MPDDPQPAKPRAPRRARRFVVKDTDDHPAAEKKIEEFLSGPTNRSGLRRKRPDESPRAPDRALDTPLDTRTDFVAALRSETARADRYGRTATVVVVKFVLGENGDRPASVEKSSSNGQEARQIDRLAGSIAFTLRREARDTDRIVRVSPNRFHVLLPETSEADALRYVDRARQACEVWFAGAALPVELRTEAASSGDGRSLIDALAAAEDRVSA